MKKYLLSLLLICLVSFCIPTAQADDTSRDPLIGMQLDLGVPDGAALGIVLSPCIYWAKLSGAITTNGFGVGWRVGLILDPLDFPIGPSATVEYGNSGSFNISSLVDEDLPDVAYSYINLHLGMEFGDPRSFRFYLKGGPSWLFLETHNLQQIIKTREEDYKKNKDLYQNAEISTLSELEATILIMPTVKLGFTLMFY